MARVRLPILVTQSKLLITDEDGDIATSPSVGESVMDFAADVLLTITSREVGGGEVDVYANETGGVPLGTEEIRTDARGRFEGWIERGRINVVATVGSQSFSDDFDLAPASDGSVDSNWIAASAITEAKLASGAVTTDKLGNSAVTLNKIAATAKDQAAATPSLRSLGTDSNQAAAGNDPRFENSRNPSGPAGGDLGGSFPNPQIASGVITNSNIASAANISESKLNLASDAAAGTASRRTLGTGATQAAAGNDARFPTSAEKSALAGAETGSAPSASNPFVTEDDSRFGVMVSPENPIDGESISANTIPADRIKTRDGSNSGVSTSQLANEVIEQLIPRGAIFPFGGASAPTGFLLCDGAYVLISQYPDLNNVLNGAYGRNATHFGLPNLSNRFPYGGSRGQSGGASTVTLSSAQIPRHSHTGSVDPGGSHRHQVWAFQATNTTATGGQTRLTTIMDGGGASIDDGLTGWDGHHGHTFTTGTAFGNSGGGTDSHENMPPWLGVNYIIKF